MPIVIRPLEPGDAPEFHRNCFPELAPDEAAERVRDDLEAAEQGNGVTLVAVEAGRVGVTAKLLRQGAVGWVFNVSAHPDFRGRGILQALLDQIAERARAMGLARLAIHVRADNARARRAYEKAGFKYAGQDGMRGEQWRYERKLAEDERDG